MSFFRHPEVQCDTDSCGESHYGLPGQRVTTVRAEAKALGWVRRKGHDYCPVHAVRPAASEGTEDQS